jgi:hypothetical protein
VRLQLPLPYLVLSAPLEHPKRPVALATRFALAGRLPFAAASMFAAALVFAAAVPQPAPRLVA